MHRGFSPDSRADGLVRAPDLGRGKVGTMMVVEIFFIVFWGDGASDKAFWWGLKVSGLVGPQCGESHFEIKVPSGILFARPYCQSSEKSKRSRCSKFCGCVMKDKKSSAGEIAAANLISMTRTNWSRSPLLHSTTLRIRNREPSAQDHASEQKFA